MLKPFIKAAALLCVTCIGIITTISWHSKQQEQVIPSLKETYKKDFLIGTALNTAQIEEKDAATDALIKQQFNAATPENIMKAEIIHPGWNEYNFALADKLVAYGIKTTLTSMLIR